MKLLKTFEIFNWEKLTRVRGAGHDAIIGEWINWWLGLDPEHLVFNPAPYAKTRSADIIFLRKTEGIYFPFGVAEIENDPKKWKKKLESLEEYDQYYPQLEFLLLCVTTRSRSEAKFQKLIEQMKEISKDSDRTWLLYRLSKIPWSQESCAIVTDSDRVFFYERINKGDLFIIKGGVCERKGHRGMVLE